MHLMTTSKKSGFSLVELLVAVSIMLILTGVVAVNLLGEPEKARIARAQADIDALKTAVNMYERDNFCVPSQQQGLEALIAKPAGSPDAVNWKKGGYLDSSKLPVDPWNHPYVYFAPGRSGEPFEIVSFGSDGKPGGTDGAADISSTK